MKHLVAIVIFKMWGLVCRMTARYAFRKWTSTSLSYIQQTEEERTEDWGWGSSKLVLCLAHSRGSQEERERARQGIHVIKGLPFKISTRQGWVLHNWYFKPYKWWEWRSQFKVFITDTSEYTCSICVCAFTQRRSPSCFDLGRIKRLKANEEMLVLKKHSSMRIIWICYWGGINWLDDISRLLKPMGLKNKPIWEYFALNVPGIWSKLI